MRQFYAEPRDFRIDAGNGSYRFLRFSNANIVEDDVPVGPNGEIRHRRPVFDITVTAEKQSPFSRAAQNETAKELYAMGLFDPNNDIPALECLDMMDFEGKDKVMQQVQENGVRIRMMESAMNLITQLAMMDDGIAAMAMQAGLLAPEQMADMKTAQAQQTAQGQPQQGTPEERVARRSMAGGENSQAAKARVRAATAASPR